jgi:glycosyltransferase involved in cell wall biosynthesis
VADSLRILGIGDAKSRHFARWATRLAERGHEVHVASGRVNPREGELDGLVVHQFQDLDRLLKVPLVRRFRMAPALAGLATRVQPDVVHSHYLLPYGYWTARAGLGPLVVSPWGKDAIVDAWNSPEAEERARVAIAPDRALAYVVNSQALEDAAVRLGADRAKFHRIFWHARIDGYSPEHADRSRWQALGWPDDAVVCLSLRNFRPYSNLDVCLRAFAKAREEAPELRLFSSAGGGWTREEFDRLAAELGVEPYMAVRDVPAAELPSVTASADFAVTLADVDSSPASLLETWSGSHRRWTNGSSRARAASSSKTATTWTPSPPRWCASPATRSCAGATASGTSARCTRASATRPRSSSRSTTRCSADEARPGARVRRRRL